MSEFFDHSLPASVTLVIGRPGSGKTTFCYRFIVRPARFFGHAKIHKPGLTDFGVIVRPKVLRGLEPGAGFHLQDCPLGPETESRGV